MRLLRTTFAVSLLTLSPLSARAADLIMNGGTVTLGGTQTYNVVSLTNGARVYVTPFNGTDRVNTGNLVIKANSITVDATSGIFAKGSGYQTGLCLNGAGPSAYPLSGGRGGCGVRDSGGGGAHIGGGGRGTKDSPGSFPAGYEEDCIGSVSAGACVSTTDCRNNDGLPTVAGLSFQHSPYTVEFGASGGDKGCRDGDGFALWAGTTTSLAGGAGGGRIVLFAANAGQTGTLNLQGFVDANGNRGCGTGNDSGGGGAGGSVLLIGDSVTIGANAQILAAGGRGGDEQPKCLSCTTSADCGGTGQTCVAGRCSPCNCTPCTSNAQCNAALGQTCKALGGAFGNVCADASNQCTPVASFYEENECKGTQTSGTCDDCGGGGGGGLVSVLSRVSSISPLAKFDVRGSYGGVCPICVGEAGGSNGELQIDGAYVGEVCDGFDNDFDGVVDNGLPPLVCNGTSMPSCVGGVPQSCPANVPSCVGSVTDTRPRFVVIVDTSGSMLNDPAGYPTFGDGSVGHVGVDTASDSDTVDGNNSRLFIAKSALNDVLAGFPQVDWALARYHQDVAVNRSCQAASWFECNMSCCSYDDPRNNSTPAFPVPPGCNPTALYPAGYPAALNANINIGWSSQADCINYAGSCGSPRRGADVLVGFGHPLGQHLRWLDGKETAFNASTTQADHCNFSGGGDCELRATGPTPLAASLDAVSDFLKPIVQCDGGVPCRKYGVILLTDGAESCMGDPIASATALKNSVSGVSIPTYVIGFSTLASEATQLNAIAAAGGTGTAFFASDGNGIANAMASIIAASTNYEKCNGLDDNCNGLVDEDFPDKGVTCDDGKKGICRGTGVRVCNAAGNATVCSITAPGATATTEVCNGLDDDCNGIVDDGGVCAACTPQLEVCNGVDDDCDGTIDDAPIDVGKPCGVTRGACVAGVTVCNAGKLDCSGSLGPQPEVCNGIDDDCDGIVDGMSKACYSGDPATIGKGICLEGVQKCASAPGSGVEAWGACAGEVDKKTETCNGLDDDCNGTVDDVAGAGAPCCPLGNCGKGICKDGTMQCSGGALHCIGAIGPAQEICNGVDDDCNGVVDDVPGTGVACDTGSVVCGAGVRACDPASGDIVCKGLGGGGAKETCNGLDDDCNGVVDDVSAADDPKIGVPCGDPTTLPPPCQQGTTACKNGAYVCVGEVKSSKEICNGKDDDCDGKVDVGATCPSGYDCTSGGCYRPCATGDLPCPGGFVCDPTNHCVPGSCLCDTCQKCTGGKCVDFCADVKCPDTWKCSCGACVDDSCVSKGCPDGKVCDRAQRACVDAPATDAGIDGGDDGGGGGGAANGGGGCGCALPGETSSASGGLFAALALALAAARRAKGGRR
jgi:hypothetical protein